MNSQFSCNFINAWKWNRSGNKLIKIQEKIQQKWFWSDFWPRARLPPSHVLANLRSRYPKTAVFQLVPKVSIPISGRSKKVSTNVFYHCKLNSLETLSLEYEQNRTKLKQWKLVANKKCSEQTTHQKFLQRVLDIIYLDGLFSLKRWVECIQSFWRTKEELSKKRPKQA